MIRDECTNFERFSAKFAENFIQNSDKLLDDPRIADVTISYSKYRNTKQSILNFSDIQAIIIFVSHIVISGFYFFIIGVDSVITFSLYNLFLTNIITFVSVLSLCQFAFMIWLCNNFNGNDIYITLKLMLIWPFLSISFIIRKIQRFIEVFPHLPKLIWYGEKKE